MTFCRLLWGLSRVYNAKKKDATVGNSNLMQNCKLLRKIMSIHDIVYEISSKLMSKIDICNFSDSLRKETK